MNNFISRWKFLIPVLVLLAVQASAQITRQPYLQAVTPSSIVVRWDSDSARIGTVYYGSSATSLTNTVSDTGTIKHEITISGLSPKQKYYYSVNGPAGGAADQYFVTAPAEGTRQSTRLWVISDFGQTFSTDSDARRLFTIGVWKEFNNNSLAADCILSLGDQTESDFDSQLQANYFNQLQNVLKMTPLYTLPGNHEETDHRAIYLASFTLPTNAEAGGAPSGTENFYSFTYGNIHVVMLTAETGDIAGVEKTWLEQDLANNKSDWLIAAMHRPMHSAGDHKTDSDPIALAEKTNWLPILEAAGVDLILAGHNHVYERSYLLDNLIGKSTTLTEANKIDTALGRPDAGHAYLKEPGQPHQGEIFLNCAAGGYNNNADDLRVPFAFMPVVVKGSDYEGSLVIDVDGSRQMNVTFLCDELDSTGGHIWDHFTIIKEARVVSIGREENLLPDAFTLSNYPNPFNPSTKISYDLPQTSHVKLVVVDMLGRTVAALVDGVQGAGNHIIDWIARDDRGFGLPSGIYLAQLQAGTAMRNIKMVVLR